jgi:predicted GIY-YIG superfamily endonuclease
VPSKETIKKKAPIELYAAPPGTSDIDLSDGVPSKSYLRDKGWNPVQVGPVPDRPITHRGIMGLRRQYALRHTGSSTINKQMGNTIEGKCAVECTEECSPWQKEQVVVCLSRTTKGKNTIIVGDPDRAIEHMWKLLTIGNQWTEYIESLLERLSMNKLNEEGNTTMQDSSSFDYDSVFPFRTCDIELPSDNTGYVYMLVSLRDFDRTYVGQTQNISVRLTQHNSGNGARETRDPYYRPYCLAGYMCNMGHLSKGHREDIEHNWAKAVRRAILEGRRDIESRLAIGEELVKQLNSIRLPDEHIRFVTTIKRIGDV